MKDCHWRQIDTIGVQVGVFGHHIFINGDTRLRATIDANLIKLECLGFSCHGNDHFQDWASGRRTVGNDAMDTTRFAQQAGRRG